MLVAMGFERNYIQRAFKVYEKNYGHAYNVDVIAEIIDRLQNKDKNKWKKTKKHSSSPNKQRPLSQQSSVPKNSLPSKASKRKSNQSHSARSLLEQKQSYLDKELSSNQENRSLVPNPLTLHSEQSSGDSQQININMNAVNLNAADNGNKTGSAIHEHDLAKNESGNDHLQSLKDEISHFPSHMTVQEAFQLKIHDKIDHRDQVGRFVFATVSEKQGTNLKIHYDGWSRKWDTWSDFSTEIHRFAVAGSISKRGAHRFEHLKKGDYIDINPIPRHPGWTHGEIRRLDRTSGQVQVVYEAMDKNYVYWTHLDNEAEIAEFTSKSGTVHPTQVDILQKGVEAAHRIRQKRYQGESKKSMENNANSNQSKTSLREQILNALNIEHQQLQSLLFSLDDTAITKLDGDATIAQIRQRTEDIMQLLRSSNGENNGAVGVNSEQNSRKRSRAKFENSDNSESIAQKHRRSVLQRQSECEPRRKRRKIQNSSRSSNEPDLTRYISPAPIHWKIQSVNDEAAQNKSNGQRGRFRIKLKVQKHPIKEALIQIGARNFNVDAMLEILANMQADSDNAVVIGEGENVRKLLIEELMLIPGVYRVNGSINDGEHEFSAAKFYDQHLASLHQSCTSLYSALQNVKRFDVLRRDQDPKTEM